jgi:hypothetical protein
LGSTTDSGDHNSGLRSPDGLVCESSDYRSINKRHVARKYHDQIIGRPLQRSDDSAERTLVGMQIMKVNDALGLILAERSAN